LAQVAELEAEVQSLSKELVNEREDRRRSERKNVQLIKDLKKQLHDSTRDTPVCQSVTRRVRNRWGLVIDVTAPRAFWFFVHFLFP
jgi:hypothetical protein